MPPVTASFCAAAAASECVGALNGAPCTRGLPPQGWYPAAEAVGAGADAFLHITAGGISVRCPCMQILRRTICRCVARMRAVDDLQDPVGCTHRNGTVAAAAYDGRSPYAIMVPDA